jgi:hypothetical protein
MAGLASPNALTRVVTVPCGLHSVQYRVVPVDSAISVPSKV